MPTILLAQEDPDAASQLSTLLQDFFPSAKLQLLTDYPTVTSTLASGSRASLLLTDVFWSDTDQSQLHPPPSGGLSRNSFRHRQSI